MIWLSFEQSFESEIDVEKIGFEIKLAKQKLQIVVGELRDILEEQQK